MLLECVTQISTKLAPERERGTPSPPFLVALARRSKDLRVICTWQEDSLILLHSEEQP